MMMESCETTFLSVSTTVNLRIEVDSHTPEDGYYCSKPFEIGGLSWLLKFKQSAASPYVTYNFVVQMISKIITPVEIKKLLIQTLNTNDQVHAQICHMLPPPVKELKYNSEISVNYQDSYGYIVQTKKNGTKGFAVTIDLEEEAENRNITAPSNWKKILVFNPAYADCEILCKSKRYPAISCILKARSKPLADLFNGNASSSLASSSMSTAKSIGIEGFDPAVVEVFLEFLITDSIAEVKMEKHCKKLFEIADKFEVKDLVRECMCHIATTVSIANFFEFVELADKYQSVDLKKACIRFAVKNAATLAESYPKDYLALPKDMLDCIHLGVIGVPYGHLIVMSVKEEGNSSSSSGSANKRAKRK